MLSAIGRGGLTLLVGFMAGVFATFGAMAVIGTLAIVRDIGGWDAREVIYLAALTISLGVFGALSIAFGREIQRILASQQLIFWMGVALGVPAAFLVWLWLAFAMNND